MATFASVKSIGIGTLLFQKLLITLCFCIVLGNSYNISNLFIVVMLVMVICDW